jgi:hypothetical protein
LSTIVFGKARVNHEIMKQFDMANASFVVTTSPLIVSKSNVSTVFVSKLKRLFAPLNKRWAGKECASARYKLSLLT